MNRTHTTRIAPRVAARIAALTLLMATLLLAFGLEARAQSNEWVNISNYTTCEVTVCLSNGTCITLFPGSVIRVTVPCSTTTLSYIACGVARTINMNDCHTGVNVGGCCADVCYNPGFIACTSFLSFNPSTRRCPCAWDIE